MVNKKFVIAVTLIVCTAVASFAAIRFSVRGQQSIDATAWIDPPDLILEVCQDFEIRVQIDVRESIPIYDYEFFLVYDASLMTANNAWDGGFLMAPVTFNWTIFPDYGGPGWDAVWCQAITLDGGASGIGILATIRFHCDGPGYNPLNLDAIYLSDIDGTNYIPTEIYNGFVEQIETRVNIYIDPPDYTVPTCTPFSVNVMADVPLGKELYAFGLVLTYNTAYVDCINIVDGGMLPPPALELHKLIDDTAGRIEFNMTSLMPPGATGTGSIAKVTFHCTGAGLSTLTIDTIVLYNSIGSKIPAVTTDGRVVQKEYWEPLKLQHLVELPYPYHLTDLPFVPLSSAEGYVEVKAELEAKGYEFDIDYGGGLYHIDSFFDVYFEPGSEPFEGTVASWWSNNTLEDGTRACLVSAEMEDGSSMAMGFVTNLLPPEQVPEVDPYIIVNAQPYLFIRIYWWAWAPVGKIVTWSYWWYDSHSHPNWFWKPYWWWRVYTRSYYYPYTVVPYWRPWWSWWWHWVYWHHWHWWCTYFPYDP